MSHDLLVQMAYLRGSLNATTRQSSSQRKVVVCLGSRHCFNFVFPAENETLGPVCLGCEAPSSSVGNSTSLPYLRVFTHSLVR